MLPVVRDARGRGNKRLVCAPSSQPISLFALSRRHPPSPNALCHPGLVDVVHRLRGRLEGPPPPELGGCCWPVGLRDRSSAMGVHPGQTGMGSPYLPGLLSPHPPPYPIPNALNGMKGRKGPFMPFRVWGIGSLDSGPGRNGRRPGELSPV